MKKIIIGFILAAFVFSSVSGQKKKEITTPVTLSYCLPKVSYLVKVKMEYIRQIPGPYRQNAEKELGMKPDITSLNEKWIVKNIKVSPVYIPDEKAMYSMTAGTDYRSVMLSLSPEGFLAGVAAGPLAMKPREQSMSYKAVEEVDEQEVDITALNTYNPLKEILDSNYTSQEIDGVMKRIWDPIVRYTAKTGQDNMSETVKEIFRIRSERTKLVGGENDVPDGKSLEIILKEFDRIEQDYLSLFMGKEEKQMVEKTFVCTLEKAGEPVVAFRFSETEGVVAKKNVTAASYMLQADDVIVPATPTQSGSQAAIFYRVPAVANVKLMKGTEELQSFQSLVPQLGIIKPFPTDIIANEDLILEFYPEYGSIKSVNRK